MKIQTACVHAGYTPAPGEPRILPIAQSTTYLYNDFDDVAALFDLKKEGHMYSRISNPTVESLECKIAALEGGIAAVAVSSGQSATLLSVLTICESGDHIVALNNLYGGTHTLLGSTLKKYGIETTFIPFDADEETIRAAIRPQTKLLFSETLGNPGLEVLDIEKMSSIAHEHGLPLFVDNTLATPALCRPFEFGADIVVHSATKYLDGHATSLGGVIVDSGTFDWTGGKYPQLTEPDPNYHGLSFTESFGPKAYATRARAVFLRDMGNVLSPFNAFLINLGTETLALRMERHSQNAWTIAKYLSEHPKIEWVRYPSLPGSAQEKLAAKYLPEGASGVVTFGVAGGEQECKALINALRLASLVVHVGDVRTHILHPASTTHRQLSAQEQLLSGITPNLVRLSVGIEDAKEIIEDLDQALRRI